MNCKLLNIITVLLLYVSELIIESTDVDIVGHALEIFADTLHQF